jgi:hypothetical protein
MIFIVCTFLISHSGGQKMTTAPRKLLTSTFLILSCFAIAADLGSKITVSGWVIDSACAYTKGLDKLIGPTCAKACARNGSPLVILRMTAPSSCPMMAKHPPLPRTPG